MVKSTPYCLISGFKSYRMVERLPTTTGCRRGATGKASGCKLQQQSRRLSMLQQVATLTTVDRHRTSGPD